MKVKFIYNRLCTHLIFSSPCLEFEGPGIEESVYLKIKLVKNKGSFKIEMLMLI